MIVYDFFFLWKICKEMKNTSNDFNLMSFLFVRGWILPKGFFWWIWVWFQNFCWISLFQSFSKTFYKKSTLEWCERKYFWDWEQIIWRMTLKALWTLLSFSVLKSLNFEFFQVKIFLTTEICAAIFSKTGFGKCVYKVCKTHYP